MVVRDGGDSALEPRAGYGGSGRRAPACAGGASDPKRARQDRLVVAAPHSSSVEAVAPAGPFGRASVPASPNFQRSPRILWLASTLALPGMRFKTAFCPAAAKTLQERCEFHRCFWRGRFPTTQGTNAGSAAPRTARQRAAPLHGPSRSG